MSGKISTLHCFLTSNGEIYVCNAYHFTLYKYSSIMGAIPTIRENLRDAVIGDMHSGLTYRTWIVPLLLLQSVL